MKLNIYSSATKTACALIQYINQLLQENPDKVFNIAFSGGMTPAIMYDLWAHEFVDSTPWNRIHFWWVDERCVRPENSESNYGQMKRLLLDVAPIPEEHIFGINGANNPKKEALRYSTLVKKLIPLKNNLPFFDMVLLGIGDDGHTSSIFPGNEKLLSSSHVYEATHNPYTGQDRIALTGRTIINAERVIFFVTGKNKAPILKNIISSGDAYPSSYIARRANNVLFFVDENAASEIENR